MTSKKNFLRHSRLYLILDKDVCGEKKLLPVLKGALRGGVDIVQFRDKSSSTRRMIELAGPLARLTQAQNRIFIVNDRPEAALAVSADGIHVGQDDAPVSVIRKLLGKDLIVGISCHSLADIQKAGKLDIDYAGFGPVFPTLTKPHMKGRGLTLLKKALNRAAFPVFAIGGIDQFNFPDILACGHTKVAVCRDICLASKPEKNAAHLKTLMENHV